MITSIIVPTFNRREWIGECLDSIIRQTYNNIEIIVIDDGSSDGTVDWIRSKPEYDHVIVHEQANSGASVARNAGIKMANGDLIAFIDSDDMLLPNHIEKAVRAFEDFPELGLFCCDSRMIDPNGEVMFGGKTWHENLAAVKNLTIGSGFRTVEDVFNSSNCFPGFTLRRQVFEELGGFEQSIFPADDYDLALRVVGSKWQVFYLHEPLCLRREHDGQCSGIHNSVKTCRKLIEALNNTIKRNPALAKKKSMIRRRLADIGLELGMSQIKEGQSSKGLKIMLWSILKDPNQLGRLAKIGGRKVKKASQG